MGVRTLADEKLDETRENINSAIKSLSDIVIGECSGHDDYTTEFRMVLGDSLHDLLKLREKLRS